MYFFAADSGTGVGIESASWSVCVNLQTVQESPGVRLYGTVCSWCGLGLCLGPSGGSHDDVLGRIWCLYDRRRGRGGGI